MLRFPPIFVSSAPKRPLGPAELLVEASFADLRHGGDGDLSRVSGFPRRVSASASANHDLSLHKKARSY